MFVSMMRAIATQDRLNRGLKAVCGVLIVFTCSTVLLQLAGIPRYYQRVTTGTVPVVSVGGEITMSNAIIAEAAAARGMAIETYAVYSIVLKLVITLGFVSVAALILWKARREWFHWFTAFVLLFYPGGELYTFTEVSQIAYTYVQLGSLLWPSYLLFLYLFPNGRAVPRWTRWIMGAVACFHFLLQATAVVAAIFNVPDELVQVFIALFPVVLAAFPLILCCQVYRYVRHATLVERTQIKWFVAGLALFVVLGLLVQVVVGLASAAYDDLAFVSDLEALLALFIPATIGIGILRYRLYDIDVIIRRTLIYSVLTAALVGIYLGSVVVLQRVLGPLFGSQNQLAVVASTLVIAALFQPLRHRIQAFIDRRFYRRKYDAARTIQAFSGRLRDEVEMDRLTHDLLGVVDETLQPAHISLWLRQPERR